MKNDNNDVFKRAAEASAKRYPPLIQVAYQDLTKLKRIYPKADTSQLAAQESDAEAVKANCQVKIQLGTKDPNQ
ncbi:hypothetical protein [Halomonas sp. 3A7M]|uniref:hypothetical protein n=1 Tax=Halomonas sp. 3A7M TaxID=2742616 RepID=UPI001865A492|nr:hypothetical protein [Halomonas sp. 3A7M]